MATHSSILAWRIPWTEEPSGYSPCGHNESDTTEKLNNNNLEMVTLYPIYAKYQLPSFSSLSWRFEIPFLKKLKNSKTKKTSMLAC